jgi:S-adenosylmethionine:tRNA ribosyltransferase-isomerase
MIGSFLGNRWRELYDLAIAEKYRFLSFGDAMLITRRTEEK